MRYHGQSFEIDTPLDEAWIRRRPGRRSQRRSIGATRRSTTLPTPAPLCRSSTCGWSSPVGPSRRSFPIAPPGEGVPRPGSDVDVWQDGGRHARCRSICATRCTHGHGYPARRSSSGGCDLCCPPASPAPCDAYGNLHLTLAGSAARCHRQGNAADPRQPCARRGARTWPTRCIAPRIPPSSRRPRISPRRSPTPAGLTVACADGPRRHLVSRHRLRPRHGDDRRLPPGRYRHHQRPYSGFSPRTRRICIFGSRSSTRASRVLRLPATSTIPTWAARCPPACRAR